MVSILPETVFEFLREMDSSGISGYAPENLLTTKKFSEPVESSDELDLYSSHE